MDVRLITLLAVPVVYVALAAGSPSVFYPALIAAELLLFMSTGPINTAIVNLVSPVDRASAVALSVLAIHCSAMCSHRPSSGRCRICPHSATR